MWPNAQETADLVTFTEENVQQIYRRTPMLKCDFNKVAMHFTLRHGCSSENLLHFFRTSFCRNTTGWLLLNKEIKKSFCATLFLFLQERNINNLIAILSPSDSRNLALLMIINKIFGILFSAVPAVWMVTCKRCNRLKQ